MFAAFSKAVGQLSDPKARGVVWIGVGSAVMVFMFLWSSVAYTLTSTTLFEILWLDAVTDILGGLATMIVTWLLFPAVASAVVGLLLDRVAEAVEARHYPDLQPAGGQAFGESVATTLKFLAILVVLNLLMVPFLLIPPVFPFVFYGVNGYLLGREYFELVALRRIGPAEARLLRKAHKGGIIVAGVITAVLLTVPVVNLLAPVIGTAAMVHLFEGWRRPAAA